MGDEEKKGIREKYDALGGRIYDIRYREEQDAKYERILNRVRPAPHHLTFDNGCGTGMLLEQLESHAVGLDLSIALISTARSRLSKKPNKHLIQGDSENLPLREQVFHQATAVTLLQNTPEPVKTLREMGRITQIRGDVVVTGLKRAYDYDEFRDMVRLSCFEDHNIESDGDERDWFAFMKKR